MNRRFPASLVAIPLAMALLWSAVPASAGVFEMRGLVAGESGLQHHYTFEGTTAAQRQEDKAGSLDLSVATYGGAPGVNYAPGFDATTDALLPTVISSSSGAGLKASGFTAPDPITVEALVAPDGSVGSTQQYAVAAAGSPTRAYFLFQRAGDLKLAAGNQGFVDGGAIRDVLPNYNSNDWYYVANTFQNSGGNTTVNSFVANLSAGETTLTQTLNNVSITGNFGTSSVNLGIGIFGASNNEAFDGQIDEVAIYGGALAQATLQSHLNALWKPAAAPQVIYREIFPNDDTTNQDFAETGWNLNRGGGESVAANTGSGPALSYVNGGPTDAVPVNSNPANGELAGGYIWSGSPGGGLDHLFWTDEFAIDRVKWNVTEVSWYQRNSATGDDVRLALRVEDDWFASDQTFSSSQSTNWEEKALDLATADWLDLDFVDGSSLALGSLSALPVQGDITAFGLYVDNKSNTFRFDTFQVMAAYIAPEPASWLLLGLGAVLLLVRRRRR